MKHLSTIGFILFTILSISTSAQTYQQRYAECSKRFNETTTSVLERTDKINECLIGATAPDFQVTTVDGKKVELSQLRGKIVILNFWSTQCKSCVEQMSLLEKLATDNAARDVVLLSLAAENQASLRKYLATQPSNFLNVASAETIRTDAFNLPALFPYTVVIGGDGKIRKMWFASVGKDEAFLNRYQTAITDCIQNGK